MIAERFLRDSAFYIIDEQMLQYRLLSQVATSYVIVVIHCKDESKVSKVSWAWQSIIKRTLGIPFFLITPQDSF